LSLWIRTWSCYHLVHITFKHVNAKSEFDALYSYIKAYENPFIREYFIYFLMVDNKNLIEKFKPQDIQELTRNITNKNIINACAEKL